MSAKSSTKHFETQTLVKVKSNPSIVWGSNGTKCFASLGSNINVSLNICLFSPFAHNRQCLSNPTGTNFIVRL